MPELPEVETLCRQLLRKISGKTITATEVYDSKLQHVKDLKGRRILTVRRRGKTVQIVLDDACTIFIHLRMSGRLLWQKDSVVPKHSRLRISFACGNIFLVDPRRFATVKVDRTRDDVVNNDVLLGFDKAAFLERHGSRKAVIKNILMDQKAIAGIGNIYACEILHLSRISPCRLAADLNGNDWKKIFENAEKILCRAIEKRGTSISDWRDLYGHQGENQHELKVYGQEGRACINCRAIIRRIKQGSRSTFYCPQCQK
jgi:formamidopyrimidine-DNA glycosylase